MHSRAANLQEQLYSDNTTHSKQFNIHYNVVM